MAIDPARIRRRMEEAERSGRPAPGVWEAQVALRALAVVIEEAPEQVPQEVSRAAVALVRAS
ncbi:hypothetical protein [Streptomyces kebangsaanensis]|uniref:hypothetical protein n=1 Tax=Streptomyces kebangsaanensis TaxID=864058 RepID=UPI00130109C2|nr:hypothetical protein [Streptomyces kebangsaanensis]